MAVHRLQHVSIPRPRGSANVARDFYTGLLGLTEKPVPVTIQHLDLLWYTIGDAELHLFSESPTDDPSQRHFCLVVDDLTDLRRRLLAAGYAPWDPEEIRGRPRYFCRDPFDNIIEFTTIEDDYLRLDAEAEAR